MSTEIKKHVLDMSKQIAPHISIDKTTGIGTVSKDDLYVSLLPEGITAEMVKTMSKHDHSFIAATGHAFTEKSIELLKENKSLPETSIKVPYGDKNLVEFSQVRTKESRNPTNDETVTTHGNLSVSIKSYVGSNRGELATVRQLAKELGAKELG